MSNIVPNIYFSSRVFLLLLLHLNLILFYHFAHWTHI